jgi:peptidoglycan/xylan/chitin deacetylase (PgdA/CDA1 family)
MWDEAGGRNIPLMTRLYYFLKPAIPWAIRIRARRLNATRLRRQFSSSWPILPSAARPPEGWLGWPNGKQFAFVLTHDVEGAIGLARCRKLADLDKALGIRAAFHFVPEGKYRVPDSLRADLEQEGCEVGVHDLYHDGTLYRSSKHFREQAQKINQYLKKWKASGFRSAFMFHNLEWLHDLDVLYDASTFDTDPFEPQPDGVGTIFPFWVQRNGSKGYVELPYTLPQDSTLFLLLRERTIDLWTKKLDWVASHGGMVLVNVHPDYISFEGRPNASEYPADLYEHLLKYVVTRYGDACWYALPREVAAFAAQFKPRLAHGTLTSDRRSDDERQA